MRMPWTRRADEAAKERKAAEQRLEQARKDWSRINREVAVTREEKQLNGWTATVTSIFSGH